MLVKSKKITKRWIMYQWWSCLAIQTEMKLLVGYQKQSYSLWYSYWKTKFEKFSNCILLRASLSYVFQCVLVVTDNVYFKFSLANVLIGSYCRDIYFIESRAYHIASRIYLETIFWSSLFANYYLVLLNVTEWRLYHNEPLLLHSSLSSLLTCDYGFTIILSVSYCTFLRYQHIVYMCEYHSFLSRKNHALDEWIITALINWMTHKSHSHILQTMSFIKDL